MLKANGVVIANQAGVTPKQVEAVQSLLDAGATIPFIARYRKEKTGSLDEVVLGEYGTAWHGWQRSIAGVRQS